MTTVTVVGDLMLDQVILTAGRRCLAGHGIDAVVRNSERQSAGGSGTIARLLASADSQAVHAIGLVGCDFAGRRVKQLLREEGVDVSGVHSRPSFSTRVRTWVTEDSRPFLRIDTEPEEKVAAASLHQVFDVDRVLPPESLDAVVISDFGRECSVSRRPRALRSNGVAIVATKRGTGLDRYSWGDILVTSTHDHWECLSEQGRDKPTKVIASRLASKIRHVFPGEVVVTCGEDGAGLLDLEGAWHWVDAKPVAARVSAGAGDTFVSIVALGVLNGRRVADVLEEAVMVASQSVCYAEIALDQLPKTVRTSVSEAPS